MIVLIVILLLVDTIYDSYAVLHSTNWAIFYFASHYIIYGLMALRTIKTTNSYYLYLCISVSAGYFLRAIVELAKIGMPYEDYVISASSWVADLSFALVVIVLMVLLYGKVRRKKR